ncbi:MAG TPA: phage head-tail connector protein [Gemmataceae bacterium]|jgi:uncharacterized phiE125 gp8 family phage protein|nr:phage head-tail connector protein [Gemmataceae bacterium]
MSLDTLANVKTRLGITTSADDTLIGLLQSSADSWIANYCGRDFIGGTYIEYFPGNSEFLMLTNFPVTSVTSVNVDPAEGFGSTTIIDPTIYVVHSERGVIQSKVGPFVAQYRHAGLVNADRAIWTRSPRAVQVVYSTATGNVPNDVKEAYAQIINHWYRQVKTQVATGFQNLGELKLGDMLYRYDQLAHLPIPAEIERLLAPYRTANI